MRVNEQIRRGLRVLLRELNEFPRKPRTPQEHDDALAAVAWVKTHTEEKK